MTTGSRANARSVEPAGLTAFFRASMLATVVLSIVVGSTVAMSSPAFATVTILDGLPGFTADVYLNGKLQVDGFKPGTGTREMRLAAGTYRVAVRNVGQSASTAPVLARSVTLGSGGNYTIVPHLMRGGGRTVTTFRN